MHASLRKIVIVVALLNLAYFGVEFAVARMIGSVSLFADSVDFLEDASLNTLIAIAVGWGASNRARLGMVLAGILLVPGVVTLWTAWQKIHSPFPPAPLPFSITATGALAVNLSSALLLVRFRKQSGSLTRAAFLSSRNDVFANFAMIVTALVTVYTRTGWPDLVVGLGIAALNADAAREVWTAARKESQPAEG